MTTNTGKTAAKKEPAAKSKKKLWIALATVAVLLIAGGITAAILLYRPTPPDPQASPESAKKFMAGKDFQRLSSSEKLAYAAKFGNERGLFRPDADSNLSDAEKAQLRENMRALFEAMMKDRLKKFFAASKEEQNKMLDEDIKRDAEREKQMQQNGGGPPGGGGPGGGPPGGNGGTPPSPPSAQERRNHEASSSPAMHAQMQVYMTLKQQRKSGQL